MPLYNETFVDGIVLEDELFHTSWTPAAGDTFYKIGEEIGGAYNPMWPSLSAVPRFTQAAYVAASITIGKHILQGSNNTTVRNGFPALLLFGGCSTSSGQHTFYVASTGSQYSVTCHAEERGGTSAILRDDLGCKLTSGAFVWDALNNIPLRFGGKWLGCYERTSSHATKPAVQLTNRPGYHTGTTASVFSKCTTMTWDSIEIIPTFFQFALDENLDAPIYEFGGTAGNDLNEKWPTNIRRTFPTTSAWEFHFWCDRLEVQQATVIDAENNKDFICKIVSPSAASLFYQFTFSNAVIEQCSMTHTIGDLANMIAVGQITVPKIIAYDGVASWG